MPRRRSATLQFNAIQLVGGLLPASLIEQIALQQAPQQKASDYDLPKNQRLQVAVDQAWNRAKALWQEAQELRRRGEAMPWAAWFSQRLLEQVFGWADLGPCPPRQIAEASFPITHQAFSGEVPLVFTSLGNDELDKGYKQFGQDSRRRSPHSCLQECLNADDGSNWGLLCNGTSLRLLHDNPALVKPAYVAVGLDQIFDGGLFDEFAVVWLLLHASRFQRRDDGSCLLDGWKQEGLQSGERALNKLRDGVQAALEAVGQGVLQHPANGELVAKLQSGELSTQAFFRQLLRLVYRLLFLCVAEDRNLLFAADVPLELRQIYREGYSLSRLRDLSIRSGAHEQLHGDLWLVQKMVFEQLRNPEGSSLGLPALGGLFEEDRCPDLDTAQLSNAALLEAVRAIGWFYDEQSQSRTRINYQALNTEEFGSVYESLLELHPQINGSGANLRFSLGGVAGSERKTSGSYYTPEDLVRLLILSALLPVIRDRLSKAATQQEKREALLAIRVLDPACGSGHFLLAAARRLALELARVDAGDDEPSEDLRRHCLREVVAKCFYGVDKNPMAVELCKVALWMEAIEPGKPLSFLDAHIQWRFAGGGVRPPGARGRHPRWRLQAPHRRRQAGLHQPEEDQSDVCGEGPGGSLHCQCDDPGAAELRGFRSNRGKRSGGGAPQRTGLSGLAQRSSHPPGAAEGRCLHRRLLPAQAGRQGASRARVSEPGCHPARSRAFRPDGRSGCQGSGRLSLPALASGLSGCDVRWRL